MTKDGIFERLYRKAVEPGTAFPLAWCYTGRVPTCETIGLDRDETQLAFGPFEVKPLAFREKRSSSLC